LFSESLLASLTPRSSVIFPLFTEASIKCYVIGISASALQQSSQVYPHEKAKVEFWSKYWQLSLRPIL
jgi:hypothetical protein